MLNAYQPPNKTPNNAVFFKSFEISIDPAAALTVVDALETVVFPRFCSSLNKDTALLMLLEDNFEVELEKEEVGNRIVPLDEVIVIDETAGVRTHRLEDATVVVVRAVVARMFTVWAESVWVVANISFFCYVWQRYGVSFILFLPYSLTCFREILARVREEEEEEPTLFCCVLDATKYHNKLSSLFSCVR